MKRVGPYLANAGIAVGCLWTFSIIWEVFVRSVNPFLVAAAYDAGRRIPAFHVFALDVLDFGKNYSLWLLWSVAGFALFCWSSRREERRSCSRLLLSLYLAPFTVITILLVAACFA